MRKLALFCCAFCTTFLASCGTQTTVSADRLNITTSVYPLGFLAQRIGGDHALVSVVTPTGVEPHDYDPSPRDIAAVEDSDIFLWNGHGVDPWANRLAPELEKRGKPTFALTSAGPLLPAREGSDDGVFDPHAWLDPVFLEGAVPVLRNLFAKTDPAHATEYQKNAAALAADLEKLNHDYRTGLKKCSLSDIVVSHDAFRYLAVRYNIHTIAIAGLSPEEEPAAKTMADIAALVEQKGIKHVFTETLASPKLSETIAREAGAETLVLNPIEGLTSEQEANGDDFLSVMRDNLEQLRIAMRCAS